MSHRKERKNECIERRSNGAGVDKTWGPWSKSHPAHQASTVKAQLAKTWRPYHRCGPFTSLWSSMTDVKCLTWGSKGGKEGRALCFKVFQSETWHLCFKVKPVRGKTLEYVRRHRDTECMRAVRDVPYMRDVKSMWLRHPRGRGRCNYTHKNPRQRWGLWDLLLIT